MELRCPLALTLIDSHQDIVYAGIPRKFWQKNGSYYTYLRDSRATGIRCKRFDKRYSKESKQESPEDVHEIIDYVGKGSLEHNKKTDDVLVQTAGCGRQLCSVTFCQESRLGRKRTTVNCVNISSQAIHERQHKNTIRHPWCSNHMPCCNQRKFAKDSNSPDAGKENGKPSNMICVCLLRRHLTM